MDRDIHTDALIYLLMVCLLFRSAHPDPVGSGAVAIIWQRTQNQATGNRGKDLVRMLRKMM